MSSLEPKQRWTLGIGAALLTLLLSAVFTFGSLDVPFEPNNWREAIALYAVSSFITAALLVFLLILTRTVLRLWTERSKEQLGARFKTKMVVGAMALSLLPVLFMFFVSYSLLNRVGANASFAERFRAHYDSAAPSHTCQAGRVQFVTSYQ